jgi:hypothetical protein
MVSPFRSKRFVFRCDICRSIPFPDEDCGSFYPEEEWQDAYEHANMRSGPELMRDTANPDAA